MGGRLDGEVAVITRGASGIGQAAVLRFLNDGARVLFGDLNEKRAKQTLGLAAKAGHEGRVRFEKTDVTKEGDVEAMIAAARKHFGRLDCVFSNAGAGGALGSLTQITVEDWDFTFALFVRGVFLGIKHGGRALLEQGEGGAMINTVSVAALSGGAGPAAYSAAKAAVVNLTRAASLEFAPRKIRVNAICLGGILTPLVHRGSPDAFEKTMVALQPWPEVGLGEHIAAAAAFLASEDARFVTGEALVVDGGITAVGPNFYKVSAADNPNWAGTGLDRGTVDF